jgi:SAM-dependent methyltransferase
MQSTPARKVGLAGEADWWDEMAASDFGPYAKEMRERLDPAMPLHWSIIQHIDAPEGATVEILDAGAGPITSVGKIWPGRNVRLTAVDPLADAYDRILAKYNIQRPVRTIRGECEALFQQFGADRFDLVFCRNAMDHTADPIAGIRNCLQVVKPRKNVVLHHFTNEGEAQKYHELHQWNFDAQEGQFVVWNPRTRILVKDAVKDLGEITLCDARTPRWLVVVLRKS